MVKRRRNNVLNVDQTLFQRRVALITLTVFLRKRYMQMSRNSQRRCFQEIEVQKRYFLELLDLLGEIIYNLRTQWAIHGQTTFK